MPSPADGPVLDVLQGREAEVGGVGLMRLLPTRARRLIGPWCFADHFGPAVIGIDAPPHPHTGLQTVTWLLAGDVLHRDSLGYEQRIVPGQLNLMTAGRGVAHAETGREGLTHGIQLWVALPLEQTTREPSFEHHPELPRHDEDGLSATLLMGSAHGLRSPATAFSPIVGVDLRIERGATARVPLDPTFEHGLIVTEESVNVEGRPVGRGSLLYLGVNRDGIEIHAPGGARALLLGGAPMAHGVVMWWNFVALSDAGIRRARADWELGDRRFGRMDPAAGERLSAPPLS